MQMLQWTDGWKWRGGAPRSREKLALSFSVGTTTESRARSSSRSGEMPCNKSLSNNDQPLASICHVCQPQLGWACRLYSMSQYWKTTSPSKLTASTDGNEVVL